MMKYSADKKYGKYYSRKKRSRMNSTMKPLGNVGTNDGVNQQDRKQNSVHALDNVKQPSPMVMFNACSKSIWSEACLKVDAHLSSKAFKIVEECSRSLQPVLEVVKLPRLQVWPKGWESSGPTDRCIGLYFFPSNSRSNEVDELVNEVIGTDSALKVTAAIADLLIFPSVVLPEQNQSFAVNKYMGNFAGGHRSLIELAVQRRYFLCLPSIITKIVHHGKHYLCGLFRRRKDIADEVVLGGEQNGSACAVPVDEGGQQAQHLLNQVDEAQPASSEQITCAMNDSDVENPQLVESTCEAQIEAQPASSEQITYVMNYSHDENLPLVVESTFTMCKCLSGTKQPNSPKAVSNCSVHHPEEVSQPGDTFVSSSTKPSVSVAAGLAEKTGHGQFCSGLEPFTAKLFRFDTAWKPPRAQELIQDVATEGALVVSVPAETVTTDADPGNSPAVGAGLNTGTDHQQRSEEGEPPQPDVVVASQSCLELFPVTEAPMGLAAPGVGTKNIMEVDLELSLGMPVVLHL